jgi:hypothetical protein
MNQEKKSTGTDGICLGVYGLLSASVTHEIKNTLSIINENAGLIQDLCSMVEGDEGLPAGRVESSMQTIASQVGRSSAIMKNLNRFAHSNDKIPGQTEMSDMLTLMVDLTSRFAAMRKVTVTTSCQPGAVIETNLLVLHSLVFLTLYKLYQVCPENSVVKITGINQSDGRPLIRFMLEGHSELPLPSDFPGEKEDELARYIGATCSRGEAEIIISLGALA